MVDWFILVGYLAVAMTAWCLDGIAHSTAAQARLERFVAMDRRNAVVEPAAAERFGPLALGLLADTSRPRAKQGAVAGLVASGALHRAPSDGLPGPGRWVAHHPLPEHANDLEGEIWRAAAPRSSAYAYGPTGHYLWDLPSGGRCLSAVERQLVREGYLRRSSLPVPDEQRGRGWWSTAAAAAAVPVVVLLIFDHAWIRAVPALLVGAVTVAVASNPGGLHRKRTLPILTAQGEMVLQHARERFADLNPATRPALTAYDPRTVAMAVALFGSQAVRHVDERILDDWYAPVTYVDGPGD